MGRTTAGTPRHPRPSASHGGPPPRPELLTAGPTRPSRRARRGTGRSTRQPADPAGPCRSRGRPRANTCSSDGRSAADHSACTPSTILHEDVVLRDRSEHRRRIRGHRHAPRLAAVDRRDERELFHARVERDVDGEERSRREADHAHGVGPTPKRSACSRTSSIARRPSSAHASHAARYSGVEMTSPIAPGLLGLWPWHRETGVDRRHRRLERRLVAGEACTRYLSRNAV